MNHFCTSTNNQLQPCVQNNYGKWNKTGKTQKAKSLRKGVVQYAPNSNSSTRQTKTNLYEQAQNQTRDLGSNTKKRFNKTQLRFQSKKAQNLYLWNMGYGSYQLTVSNEFNLKMGINSGYRMDNKTCVANIWCGLWIGIRYKYTFTFTLKITKN